MGCCVGDDPLPAKEASKEEDGLPTSSCSKDFFFFFIFFILVQEFRISSGSSLPFLLVSISSKDMAVKEALLGGAAFFFSFATTVTFFPRGWVGLFLFRGGDSWVGEGSPCRLLLAQAVQACRTEIQNQRCDEESHG